MIHTINRIFCVCYILMVSGCISTQPKNELNDFKLYKQIPLIETYKEVVKEPYLIHVYDCSNKAAKYARELRSSGYMADVIIIKPKNSNSGLYHAVVRTNSKHIILYVDPTNNEWATDLSLFGEYVHLVDWVHINNMYEEFGDRVKEIPVPVRVR